MKNLKINTSINLKQDLKNNFQLAQIKKKIETFVDSPLHSKLSNI